MYRSLDDRAFERTPVYKFNLLASSFFKTPNDQHFFWYDKFSRSCSGVLEFRPSKLSFVPEELCRYNVIHLVSIFLHQKNKRFGLFRCAMEILKDISNQSGCGIVFCARSFKMKMPNIRTTDDGLKFLENYDKYFGYIKNKQEEWDKSQLLLSSYLKFGFCRFKFSADDLDNDKWANNGVVFLPDNIDKSVYDCFEKRLDCSESGVGINVDIDELKRKRREKKKRCKKKCV
jgi:hypothetical protein